MLGANPVASALGAFTNGCENGQAVLWNEVEGAELVMATHDRALAIAAQAHGLALIGIER